jgi:hypothetical protein
MLLFVGSLASGFACAPAARAPAPASASVAGGHAPTASASAASSAAIDGPNLEHGAAVAHLAASPWGARLDKRGVIAVPLLDGPAWTHVRFWGVTTLAGWRYGDDHHAVAAVFSFPPPATGAAGASGAVATVATVDACADKFADWGRPKARAFDLELGTPRVDEVAWQGKRARVFVLDAARRSIFGAKRYYAAYAVLPAWRDACVVVGFAVPGAGADEDARLVRDRWVRDGVPALVAKPDAGARALEQKTFD